jgi:hypothetical protein
MLGYCLSHGPVLGLGYCYLLVNVLEVGADRLAIFPAGKGQGIAHYVDHAQLHLDVGNTEAIASGKPVKLYRRRLQTHP